MLIDIVSQKGEVWEEPDSTLVTLIKIKTRGADKLKSAIELDHNGETLTFNSQSELAVMAAARKLGWGPPSDGKF
jgi:hypothetical protein